MLFNSNFRYTAYVITNNSKETYESNDPTAIKAILDEYIEIFSVEIFNEENSTIGLIDNSTGEIHFLKLHEYVFDHLITDTYKSEFFKEYFE